MFGPALWTESVLTRRTIRGPRPLSLAAASSWSAASAAPLQVPLALLDGRVEAIVWPPGRAGRVPPPPPAAAGRVVIPGEPAAPTAAGEGEPPPAGA